MGLDQRVTYLNAAAEQKYGLRAATALGCKLSELYEFRWLNAEDEAEAMLALRERGKWRGENIHVTKAGVEMHVESCVTMVRAGDGSPMGMTAIIRDITERKQLDRLLNEKNAELERAKTVAEKANSAKSEFLSSMSHELRTPLNAILGFTQLLEIGHPPLTAQQQLSIGQILKAGWHLLNMVNEILDLSMIESRGVTLSKEVLSVATVLQECQALIESLAEQRGIRMTFPLDVPFYVHADRTRLKQALINLLTNAIKYNRSRGAVNVECRLTDKGRVRIDVKDSGVGLAPEQVANLFQVFNRLGQEASTTEGNGIGLVVTRQLIELMGGTIGVESRVGVGSDFWFELEAMTAPELPTGALGATDPNTVEPMATQERQRTVLYVEDNPANLLLVEQLIARRRDLKLLTAIDAHSGIQMARVHQPDLILMDIKLPGLNGYGALKILREDVTTAHIPVVALSANAMLGDIEMGLKAGFCSYVTKPIKIDEFMKAVAVALSHATERRQAFQGVAS